MTGTRRGATAGSCVALFASFLASPARADGAKVQLDWDAPAGDSCPGGAEVIAQVSKLTEASKTSAHPPVRARAQVRKLGEGRFRVELTTLVDGKQGRRVIEERSCQAMAEATVVILAWMVDPDLAAATPASEPLRNTRRGGASSPEAAGGAVASASRGGQGPPESNPAKSSQPAERDRTEPPAPKRTGGAPAFFVGADFLSDVGTLPANGFGVGPRLGIRWNALRVAVYGDVWANQTTRNDAGEGASFRLLTLGIDACLAPFPVELAACAGPELDRLAGKGLGVNEPTSNDSVWLALGVGLAGGVPLAGPVKLTASARAAFPTNRERFGLDGIGIVHRPAVVSGRFALGLELGF